MLQPSKEGCRAAGGTQYTKTPLDKNGGTPRETEEGPSATSPDLEETQDSVPYDMGKPGRDSTHRSRESTQEKSGMQSSIRQSETSTTDRNADPLKKRG